ncbi:MAG: hypothetical protein B9S33_10880 [Pedosphaera sp. Tous-C6FEB]|nr:MAG: hypothetical protein B9S33_10880 [Pedosphaera sp. Tous-C6FEB]
MSRQTAELEPTPADAGPLNFDDSQCAARAQLTARGGDTPVPNPPAKKTGKKDRDAAFDARD